MVRLPTSAQQKTISLVWQPAEKFSLSVHRDQKRRILLLYRRQATMLSWSALSWPTPLDLNFMTGHSPSWKRHHYYQLTWKKPSGANLEMLWRYEQYFYPGSGWGSGFMTREGSTGLIRVDIRP
jgi:hypothetical protein